MYELDRGRTGIIVSNILGDHKHDSWGYWQVLLWHEWCTIFGQVHLDSWFHLVRLLVYLVELVAAASFKYSFMNNFTRVFSLISMCTTAGKLNVNWNIWSIYLKSLSFALKEFNCKIKLSLKYCINWLKPSFNKWYTCWAKGLHVDEYVVKHLS